MEYDMLLSKITDIDENMCFGRIVTKLYQNNPEAMKELINQVPEKKRDFMWKLLQTQKVSIEVDGRTIVTNRRIVKAVRRGKQD